MTDPGRRDFDHLLTTSEFGESLVRRRSDGDNEFSDAEVDGVLAALDVLDAAPTTMPGALNLHELKRERRPWWSITPPTPPGTAVRILVRPERLGNTGLWIIGPVTRHYRAAPSGT